jgi:hypothetical protein
MEAEQHVWRRVLRVFVLMSSINPSRTICSGPTEQKVIVLSFGSMFLASRSHIFL